MLAVYWEPWSLWNNNPPGHAPCDEGFVEGPQGEFGVDAVGNAISKQNIYFTAVESVV